jgi:hypothetical protein
MNLKLVLSYFLIFQSNKLNDTSGKDERPLSCLENQLESQIANEIEVKKIYEINYKKNLLELLKSKYISISDKLDKINEINKNENEIQTQSNILNRGLLDDW